VENTYDADGNLSKREDSADGDTTYDYNGLGQLAYELYPSGRHNAYAYDRAGNLTDITDNDGTTIYTYDEVNRLASLLEPGESNPITYSYDDDADHNERTVTRPNGTVSIERTNKAEQMTFTCTRPSSASTACSTGPASGRLFSEQYSYLNGSSNPTSLLTSIANKDGRHTVFGYDELGRVTIGQTGVGGGVDDRWEYVYDAAGNMTWWGRLSHPVKTMAYNAANELCVRVTSTTIPTSCTPPTGAETFTYDDTGNLTEQTGGAGLEFDYNARNQITGVLEGASLVSRSFAGPGQAEQTGLGTRDISHNALGTSKIGDERFVRQPDGQLVSQMGGTPGHRYFQLDHQGSVRQQTNTSGSAVTQTTYDPYGRSLGPDNPGQSGLWFGYTGANTDTAGLIHNGQRFYSPDLMRWTQPDPINQPADLGQANRYVYVRGDPINSIDPSGTISLSEVVRGVDETIRSISRPGQLEQAWECGWGLGEGSLDECDPLELALGEDVASAY
jgi:RHS repeat-associated protein